MVDITYSAGTNTITVIGGSSGSPHNFTDVYNSDVSGGWGKVTKQGTSQFDFQAKLQIGDGSTQTYFTDTYKQISFLSNIFTGNSQNKILVMDKATFTLGKQSASLKQGYGGCTIISNETSYYGSLIKPNSNTSTCVINLFGCTFSATETSTDQWVQGSKIYDCTFNFAAYLHTSTYTTGDINNIICTWGTAMFRRPNSGFTISNLVGSTSGWGYGVWFQSQGGAIKNISFTNTVAGGGYSVLLENVPADCFIINGVMLPSWTIHWVGTCAGKLFRQYEFDLQVVDNQNNGLPIQGARYRIFDKDGFELTKTGSGYTSVPYVVLSAPAGEGTQATAHAILDPNGYGQISSFVIDNPGSGYVSTPTITIDAPSNGVQATAQATILNGALLAITPTTYTDANGNIPTRCVTRGYYDQVHGDVLQDYAPLLIVITKDGFMDYKDTMNIAMKTAYQISISHTVPVIFTSGGRRLIDMKPTDPQSLVYLEF